MLASSSWYITTSFSAIICFFFLCSSVFWHDLGIGRIPTLLMSEQSTAMKFGFLLPRGTVPAMVAIRDRTHREILRGERGRAGGLGPFLLLPPFFLLASLSSLASLLPSLLWPLASPLSFPSLSPAPAVALPPG